MVRWYYFPTYTAKIVRWDEVRGVRSMEHSIWTVKSHGMSLSPIWWSMHWTRFDSGQYPMHILVDCNSAPSCFSPAIGLSPVVEDFNRVMDLLKSKIIKED